MASIFGLKLKGRRSFIGLDGEGNQGNLYLDNKKIAWYNDSGNGAPADVEYYNGRPGREMYEPKLKEIVGKYFKRFPIQGDDGRYARFEPDIEMLVCCLLDLMDDEKQYKKYLKIGYNRTVIFKVGINGIMKYCGCKGDAGVEELKKKQNVIIKKIYTSLEDFEIK